MRRRPKPPLSIFRRFGRSNSGVVALVVALAAPVLVIMAGVAVDLARTVKARTTLQQAADAAVLAGAGAMRTTSAPAASSVAEAIARDLARSLDNLAVSTSTTTTDMQADLAADVPTTLLKLAGSSSVHLKARARARLLGSTPTCIVVLDIAQKDAFDVDNATLNAKGCAAYSNSKAPDSIWLDKGSALNTEFTCSSGGAKATGGATFNPPAITDCPVKTDPLMGWPAPPVGTTCDAKKLSIAVTTVLTPGVYCGGINVQTNAAVTLLPGVYVIKDGPLKLNGDASLVGSGVSLYLTGNGAILDVDGAAAMNLSAPSAGSMTGILVFEDPAASLNNVHKLHSRNAPNLLGTIYLPRGELQIGAPGGYTATSDGMAQNSAWTIIVARVLSVHDKISLTLNTNFGATSVKPPPNAVPSPTVRLVN